MNNRDDIPNRTLLQTPLFKILFFTPIAISLFLAFGIYHQNDIYISLKAVDIENALIAFKLPLIIMGLTIPLTALSASIHRSQQTQKQILSQQLQNQFSNHFKHLEEFKKQFTGEEISLITELWGSSEQMHGFFYPNTHIGEYNSTFKIRELENLIESFTNTGAKFDKSTHIVFNKFLKDISNILGIDAENNQYNLLFENTLYSAINKAYVFSGIKKQKSIKIDNFIHQLSIVGSIGFFF